MSVNKQQRKICETKVKKVSEFSTVLKTNELSFVAFKNTGINANEFYKMRSIARSKNLTIKVFPNRLAQIALKNLGIENEILAKLMKEQLILVINNDVIKCLNLISLLPKPISKQLSPILLIEKDYVLINPQKLIKYSKLSQKSDLVTNIYQTIKLIKETKFPESVENKENI